MSFDQAVHTGSTDEEEASAKARHDIRASLAIARGFNHAMDSSFTDFCNSVHQVLLANDIASSDEAVKRIGVFEEDCRFCLSRMERSLAQLAERIDASGHRDHACSGASAQ